MSDPIIIRPLEKGERAGLCNYPIDGLPCRPAKYVNADNTRRFCGPCAIQAQLGGFAVEGAAAARRVVEAKQRHAAEHRTVTPAKVPAGRCGCGCGQTAGGTFLPGHDSKLKAARRRAGLDPYTGEKP